MTDTAQPRSGDRLRSIADDFLALSRDIQRAKPVASVASLHPLASEYAAAQGIANTTLGLLLTASHHPLAFHTNDGHYAVEYLGLAVRHAADAVAHLAKAVADIAGYHRVDGLPDPATGRTGPRRPVHRDSVHTHLGNAAKALAEGYVRASDAAEYLDAAQHRTEPASAGAGPARPEAADRVAAGERIARTLSSAQSGALRMTGRGYARLHEDPGGKRHIETGTSTRITMATFESLRGKGLVEVEDGGRLLYFGRRLHLTADGQHTLAALGRAASDTRPLTPARPTPAAQSR